MQSKHRKFFVVLWLIVAILFTSASAREPQKSKPGPLMIQEQGSLAVGGSTTTAPGTSTPSGRADNPEGTDPAGQTTRR
jgi:hypothetical protein